MGEKLIANGTFLFVGDKFYNIIYWANNMYLLPLISSQGASQSLKYEKTFIMFQTKNFIKKIWICFAIWFPRHTTVLVFLLRICIWRQTSKWNFSHQCTVPTMLYGRVTFLEFQCPLSVVYRWIKPNAFNQGKFGLKSVQKFIFEPSGLHSTGLVAFQSGKVTRACKVYGICLKLLLKLRLSFSQKETSHILPCWELWGFKVQQGRT